MSANLGWMGRRTVLLVMTAGLVAGCGSGDNVAGAGSSTGGSSNSGGASYVATGGSPSGGASSTASSSQTGIANRGGASSETSGGSGSPFGSGAASSNHAGTPNRGGNWSATAGGAMNSSVAGTSGQTVSAGTSGSGIAPEAILRGMSPMGITNDGTNLYWSTLFGSLDMRPLAGGDTVHVASWASNSGLMPLVHTASGLFLFANSKLVRCTTAGECVDITNDISEFVVDDDEIIWLADLGDVRRMPLDGTSSELLLHDPWISTIGLHDNVIYYELDGDLYSVNTPGAEAKKLGPIGEYASQMAFDDRFIYAVLSSSTLVRVGYDGTGRKELMKAGNISDLTVAQGQLYFMAKGIAGCSTTDINRYDPSTDVIETVLAKFPCIMDYTIAAREIYFTYFGLSDSAIYRMPLP